MPGAYAHISAVHHLMSGNVLDGIDMPDIAKAAVTEWPEFCILGAVSPDYPYLDIGNKDACKWADAMHHGRTDQFMHFAVSEIRKMPDSDDRNKCIAWLLGFVAHVGLDMTIHPIVEGVAGIYSESKENQKKHRICEMHQDVHIWQRMNLGTVGRCETIDKIRYCSAPDKSDCLCESVRVLWNNALQQTYHVLWKNNPPDIDTWHQKFSFIVDKIEESHQWPRFARHVSVNAGVSYPLPEEVEDQYIKNLETPEGQRLDYDKIFDDGLINITTLWSAISKAIVDSTGSHLSVFGDWSLDRGLINNSEEYVFWSNEDTVSQRLPSSS